MRTLLILCGVLFVALATPVLAQDGKLALTPIDGGFEVKLAGHTLRMPLPMWATPSDVPVDQANVIYRELEDGVESVVLLPLDQTVVTWTQLMGALVVHRPGYSAGAQVTSIVGPMAKSCPQDLLLAKPLAAAKPGWSEGLLVMCGRYNPTAQASTRNCAAGIVLAVVMESPEGAAKVYLEWCTSAFNPANQATWPVPESELVRSATILQAVSRLELNPAAGAAP